MSFSLRKNGTTYTFTAQNEYDTKMWTSALKPFVVQEDVWSEYIFSHIIGQGSYGKVFLANRILSASESQSGNNDFTESQIDSAVPVAIKILDKEGLA